MTRPRGFPSWEELYQKDTIERLPWYWPALDPDLEAALARHGMASGRILDQGTGPGTQAIALAERGFTVTATDISAAGSIRTRRRSWQRFGEGDERVVRRVSCQCDHPFSSTVFLSGDGGRGSAFFGPLDSDDNCGFFEKSRSSGMT
jgi:SAM-dependent methyltransferase